MMTPLDNETTALSDRQQSIIDRVTTSGFATIEALADELGVSGQTVRRDIRRLEDLRVLQRFHGGAGLKEQTIRPAFELKSETARDAKIGIGEAIARIVPDGAAVFLDVGTTINAAAHALTKRRGLRVFTNNLQAALILATQSDAEILVAGGMIRGADGSTVGVVAARLLETVRADYAVIGFSGFEPDGIVTDFDPDKIAIKQIMMRNSSCAILVGDGSKFARRATMRLAAVSEFSDVITDSSLDSESHALITRLGVRLRLARIGV